MDEQQKAPAYQWYPDKALADTRRLSWAAKGFYRELLDVIWMQYQDTCSIPDDDQFIASELGASIDDWRAAKAEIMCDFRPLLTRLETNRLFSNGLMKERRKQLERREKLRENGMHGGRPRKTKENQKQSLPSPTPSPTPSVDTENTPTGEPDSAWTLEDFQRAAQTIGMLPADVEACYHHYAAVGFIDAANRKIKSIPSLLAKWKASQPSHGKRYQQAKQDEREEIRRIVEDSGL